MNNDENKVQEDENKKKEPLLKKNMGKKYRNKMLVNYKNKRIGG